MLDFEKIRPMVKGKMVHYKRQAPYYKEVMALLDRIFSVATDSLVDLNVRALSGVCNYLGLPFKYRLASSMSLDRASILHAGSWALEIADLMGASQYLNPVSGASIFVPEDFRLRGIDLKFLTFDNPVYSVGSYGFESGLSILDVLMWNSVPQVREMLVKQSRIV